MKAIKKLSKLVAAGALMTVFAFNFNACSNGTPLAPETQSDNMVGLSKEGSLSSSKWLTSEEGGKLKLSSNYGDNGMKIKVKMKVKSGSLTKDAELSLRMDDLNYFIGTFAAISNDVELTKNSILNITIENADLSSLEADKIDIYSENPETGEWQKVNAKSVEIDKADGRIEVVKAKMSGFSRFALYVPNEKAAESHSETEESNNNDASGPDNHSNFFDNILNPSYPQSDSIIVNFNQQTGSYDGGLIYLSNGALFTFPGGSFTPPPGTPEGAAVTVTMSVELDAGSNELIYSFGPHGAQFSPRATLMLAFGDIVDNTGSAALYYLDEAGNHIETFPDLFDMVEHLMYLKIPHFSRYAVAWSR